MANVITINTRNDLVEVARNLGVRPDWHEPDEQEVNARVVGDHLDNAMGSTVTDNVGEYNVVLTRLDDEGEPQDVAVVNLATLLAFATGTYEG